MLAPFEFVITRDESGRNWNHLAQNTKILPFTPQLTNFTGTDPIQKRGYTFLYGPMCWVYVHLKGDAFGWSGGATILVPINPYVPTQDEFPQVINPVVDLSTKLAVNNEHVRITPSANGGLLTLDTALSSTEGPTEILLTGWYVRNNRRPDSSWGDPPT